MVFLQYLLWIISILAIQASQLNNGGDKNAITVDNMTESLEAINGTPNYRLIKPNRATPWYPEREIKLDSCVRRARCEHLDKLTCLGAKLSYDKTSVLLTFYETQNQIQTQLELYKELINVPKCWAVIQPLLCATFMPKCEKILGQDMVYLPSYEMCKITMEPCAILYNTSYFPSFLKCNSTLFPTRCDNAVREMKFNTTGKCLPPLIHTHKALHFYEGISGCGLPCRDPLYTEDEHQQIHRLVAWGAGMCLALNLLTVATFLIDWRSANKYPALVIFYINVCFAVASMGWLVQFGVGSRDDIVCSKDGTRRQGEPSAEENLSCVVVFVLVYYFMMAACVWFVIFTYAWHMSFRALGKIQDRIDKKAAYFHLVAWSLPLVLTITTMAFGEVDGSSVTGVCFVGYVSHPMRAGLLLAPLAVVLVIGGYFLLRGVFSLIAVRVSSKDVISPRASNKIRQTITRCSLTAALVAVFICVTFACHIYEFRNAELWREAFKKNIICRLEALKDSEKECGSASGRLCRCCSCGCCAASRRARSWPRGRGRRPPPPPGAATSPGSSACYLLVQCGSGLRLLLARTVRQWRPAVCVGAAAAAAVLLRGGRAHGLVDVDAGRRRRLAPLPRQVAPPATCSYSAAVASGRLCRCCSCGCCAASRRARSWPRGRGRRPPPPPGAATSPGSSACYLLVQCGSGVRPSVSVLQLRLLCCFAAGALMASWTWDAGRRRRLAPLPRQVAPPATCSYSAAVASGRLCRCCSCGCCAASRRARSWPRGRGRRPPPPPGAATSPGSSACYLLVQCGSGVRPSVSVLQLRLLCCFAAGAPMASWTWTPAAAAAWRRYLARKFGCSVEAEVSRRARKHELIARAYRRRGEFAARGRLSISLGGSRQDPVGLCLDHTSPIDCPEDGKHESGELSSSWAANLPRFVRRRDALVLPAHTHTHHSLSSTPDRRNSQDSQISISLRHVSVESRRNSLDSQLSVKIAEMKTKVGRRRTKHTKAKRKARAANARKESTPSIESQISRYWLQAVAANNDPSREEVKFSFD
ncbi:hypothetical protein ACJJTC_005891 [Scirpophaga incertulas]